MYCIELYLKVYIFKKIFVKKSMSECTHGLHSINFFLGRRLLNQTNTYLYYHYHYIITMKTKYHLIIMIIILFTSLVYNTYEDANKVEQVPYGSIIQYDLIVPYDPITPYEPVYVLLENIMLNEDLFTIVSLSTNHTPINITDNAYAIDVSYNKAIEFIKHDKTDERLYNDTFRCCEFARTVHNNAERHGIRAHLVLIIYDDKYKTTHLINAFNTTDKGMIFIDSTGTTYGCKEYDREVTLFEGHNATGKSIYNDAMWFNGVVERFYII